MSFSLICHLGLFCELWIPTLAYSVIPTLASSLICHSGLSAKYRICVVLEKCKCWTYVCLKKCTMLCLRVFSEMKHVPVDFVATHYPVPCKFGNGLRYHPPALFRLIFSKILYNIFVSTKLRFKWALNRYNWVQIGGGVHYNSQICPQISS